MHDKELHKLGKTELLSVILNQEKKINELKQENEDLKKKLEDKTININKAGSIAEASLKLNEIFEKAQEAADEYLKSVKENATKQDYAGNETGITKDKLEDKDNLINKKEEEANLDIAKDDNYLGMVVIEEKRLTKLKLSLLKKIKAIYGKVCSIFVDFKKKLKDSKEKRLKKKELKRKEKEKIKEKEKLKNDKNVKNDNNDKNKIKDNDKKEKNKIVVFFNKKKKEISNKIDKRKKLKSRERKIKKKNKEIIKNKKLKEKNKKLKLKEKEKTLKEKNKLKGKRKKEKEKLKEEKKRKKNNKDDKGKKSLKKKDNKKKDSKKSNKKKIDIKKKVNDNLKKIKKVLVFSFFKNKFKSLKENTKKKISKNSNKKEKNKKFFKNIFTKLKFRNINEVTKDNIEQKEKNKIKRVKNVQKDLLKNPNIEIDVNKLEKEIKNRKTVASRVSFLRTFLFSSIVVVAFAIIAATRIFNIIQVSGNSMEPNLYSGDLLITSKFFNYNKGDIVAFYYNDNVLIKRIVATGGDVVSITPEGKVFVNNEELKEDYVKELAFGKTDITFPYIVPNNDVFLLGDNREVSLDSRSKSIGTISKNNILGKIKIKLKPFTIF